MSLDSPGSVPEQCRRNWCRGPNPSKGKECLHLEIQRRLRLLGLPLDQQINQVGERDQLQAPALFIEPEEQSIGAGWKVQPAGDMSFERKSGSGAKSVAMTVLPSTCSLGEAGSRTRLANPTCRFMAHHRKAY
jgi:hypothetical protein